jgi:hypothetical protein
VKILTLVYLKSGLPAVGASIQDNDVLDDGNFKDDENKTFFSHDSTTMPRSGDLVKNRI